ncbi:tape measure protein [Cytobacillus horneckiae]|uniref:tape measure protein n=1 Tax=Cytobacillus horneckiae TaxID=549687 RepID=UPI0034CE4AC3
MADGSIRIEIEVDGRQINTVVRELDNLENAATRSGRGVQSSADSLSDLGNSSANAGNSIRGASNAVDDLGASSTNAGRSLDGADSAVDGLGVSSEQAARSVQGAASSLEGLSDSGVDAGRNLDGADRAIDELGGSSAQAASGVQGVSNSLDDVSTNANSAAHNVNAASDQVENVGRETNNASVGIKELAISLGLVALASKAFEVLKASMDAAISRFDTLNAFPVIMEQVGFSAKESQAAIDKLSTGIDGLPTTLDTVAATTQRIATMTNDLDGAVNATLALNNAFIASGSDSANAARGLEQYVQMLAKGEVDLQSWRTLQETMGVALNDVAKAFGFAGASAQNDLYSALQEGTITFDQFNAKIIELDQATGGFAERAKTSSSGIATSLGNLRNAAAKGIADIIKSFDKLSKDVTGKDIAQNIDSLKVIVNQSFKVIGSVIEGATPIVKAFGSAVGATLPVVKALSPVLISLASAFAAQLIINKVIVAVKASNTAMITAAASQQALTLATRAQVVAQIASTNATRADTLATMANTGAISLGSLAIGVLSGKIKLATAAKIAWAAATKLVMGPIGWITLGIGALVGAVIGLVKWFNKASEEEKKLAEDTEKLGESVNSLNDQVNTNAEAYKKNQTEIIASTKANEELAKKIEDLAGKEKKSAAEKELLSQYIEQLNGRVEGLNLAYSEEANALSMSSEQLQARIGLIKEQTSYNDALQRQTEIIEEQTEVQMKLEEVNALQEEWNQKKEEGTVKISKYKDEIAKLTEKEAALKETEAQLSEQYKATEEQITASMQAVTEATANGVTNQVIKFEELTEAQQATVESLQSTWEDYKTAATDMFDTLSEKSEISVSEMTANLQENQRIISDWAVNIATLAERGVDEGLLNTLREAGPESAGHVNALVNASDKELEALSSAFKKGGDTATDALSKSLGIEESGVMEAVGHLVTGTEQSLAQQIEAANFKGIGSAIPKGLESGVKEGTDKAKTASKNMADETTNAAKNALEINSPSKVFQRLGSGITEGLVLGINQGSNSVMQSVQKMFKSILESSERNFRQISKGHDDSVKIIEKSLKKLPKVTQEAMKSMLDRMKSGANDQTTTMRMLAVNLITPFNSTRGQFNSVGRNAMAGLNQGLLAGRAMVLSTARSIANSVASTMKSALRIHSPSRLMRDDVGKMIPAGIALGIRENAKSVYKELDTLSKGMILTSTPEQALGTSRMATLNTGATVSAMKNNNDMFKSIYDDSKVISLLKQIADKSGDVFLAEDKVGSFVDKNQGLRTFLASRRVAYNE